jgi:selenocysteine lyase/cysteine desulfurase
MIYFDNAATSWPKPPGVAAAMVHFLEEVGANPGRSGHRLSLQAGRIVYEARERIAELFGAPAPLEQPDFLPDLCKSGTANAVGLAALAAGVGWVLARGVETIRRHEMALAQRLIDGLLEVPGVTVHGGLDATRQTATISFHIAGLEPSEVGLRLDDEYGILCRVGLHCAPAAHRTLGTFPRGTVRFSLGAFSVKDEVDAALRAVREIANGRI